MKILLCTNGQVHAEQALNFAGELFRYLRPGGTVVSVAERLAHPCERERIWVDRGMRILESYDIETDTRIRQGPIADELIKEAKGGNYDVLVIGSRGFSDILAGVAEIILGDITREIVDKAESSLLVVKGPRPIRKVLLCTDGSQHAEGAIRFWGKLSIPTEPRVNIINVVPEIYGRFKDVLEPVPDTHLNMLGALPGKRTEYLYRAKDLLAEYGIRAKVKLREGGAAEELLKEAENDYDLIVMGTGGRKGDKKNTLGRQTRRVIRQAKIPVLAIRAKN